MPFKSKAQRRWMYANHPEMAKHWEADTPKNAKLPNYKNPHHSHPFSKYPGEPNCQICGLPKAEHAIK